MRRMTALHRLPARRRGAVAIIAAVALVVLLGFAGLVLDLGRLFINKSELQTAADACALAAANELVCDTSAPGVCPAKFLLNAQSAGIFVAGRNLRDFQKSAVTITPADVKFSTALAPNAAYRSAAAGADVRSKFAMCTARSTGIVPWFMGVLGIGPSDVDAMAVATLAPSISFCDPAPMGVCAAGAAPDYGLVPHQWLHSSFAGNKDLLTGAFHWIDYQPTAGGTPDLEAILSGQTHFCNVKVGDNVVENGTKNGAKDAYNTRFGLYNNKYSASSAPPDKTGYAYPTKHPPAAFAIDFVGPAGMPSPPASAPGQLSAYEDYRANQVANRPYIATDYPPAGLKKPANEPPPTTDHVQYGVQRRVVSVPIIGCSGNNNPILAMGCALMLNPMGNGNTELYLEYLGLATDASSPCRTAGPPGGGGGNGPLVPTLVQ